MNLVWTLYSTWPWHAFSLSGLTPTFFFFEARCPIKWVHRNEKTWFWHRLFFNGRFATSRSAAVRPSWTSAGMASTASRFLLPTWSDEAVAVGALSVVFDTAFVRHTLLVMLELGPASKVSDFTEDSPSVAAFPSGMMSNPSRNLNFPPPCSGFSTPTPPVRWI